MGRIIVSDNLSLDGVMQDPAGDEGFDRGGWVGAIKDRPELGQLALDDALGSDAMLMGRRTYAWFAGRWPSRTGALADRLNGMPKYVVSSTLRDLAWNNSTVLAGDLCDGAASRRAAAEGLPRGAGRRPAPLWRDERTQGDAARRRPDDRRRHRLPHLRAKGVTT